MSPAAEDGSSTESLLDATLSTTFANVLATASLTAADTALATASLIRFTDDPLDVLASRNRANRLLLNCLLLRALRLRRLLLSSLRLRSRGGRVLSLGSSSRFISDRKCLINLWWRLRYLRRGWRLCLRIFGFLVFVDSVSLSINTARTCSA